MENTNKTLEKVIIKKEVEALVSIIKKEDTRPWIRGFLITEGNILATDGRILAKMSLNTDLSKEEIPTNIKIGADTNIIWVSAEGIKKALTNIKKKTALPTIQENVYISKEDGVIKLQVLDENLNAITIEENISDDIAKTYPETEFLLNPKEDIERQSIVIDGKTFIKLSNMIKKLEKNTSIEMNIAADTKKPVLFKIRDEENIKITGVFMLINNTKK